MGKELTKRARELSHDIRWGCDTHSNEPMGCPNDCPRHRLAIIEKALAGVFKRGLLVEAKQLDSWRKQDNVTYCGLEDEKRDLCGEDEVPFTLTGNVYRTKGD